MSLRVLIWPLIGLGVVVAVTLIERWQRRENGWLDHVDILRRSGGL